MFRNLSVAVFSLACAVSACADAPDATAEPTAEATAYIDMASEIPADADMSRGDVARDGYGRPWTYEGLGAPVPDFIAETTTGQSFGTSQLDGQWTVLQVWGIWCHDSMNDAPFAAALSTAIAQDPDLEFLTLHTPYNQETAHRATKSYASVADWFAERDYTYTTLLDPDASLRELLQIRWTPSYLVIAPDRTVRGFRTGLAEAGDDAIKQFLRDIAATRATWQADKP